MNTAGTIKVHDLADVAVLKLGEGEYKTMKINKLDYEELMDVVNNPTTATIAAAVQGKDLTSRASHFHWRELKQSPE